MSGKLHLICMKTLLSNIRCSCRLSISLQRSIAQYHKINLQSLIVVNLRLIEHVQFCLLDYVTC